MQIQSYPIIEALDNEVYTSVLIGRYFLMVNKNKPQGNATSCLGPGVRGYPKFDHHFWVSQRLDITQQNQTMSDG